MGFKLRVKVGFPSSNDKPADKVIKVWGGGFQKGCQILGKKTLLPAFLRTQRIKVISDIFGIFVSNVQSIAAQQKSRLLLNPEMQS